MAIAVALLIFVFGILTMPLADSGARIIGYIGRKIRSWTEWQVHAQRGRKALRTGVQDAKRAVADAVESQRAVPEEVAIQADRQTKLEEAQKKLATLSEGLAKVERRKRSIGGWWIRNTDATESAIGSPASEAGSGLEDRIVVGARRAGMEERLEKLEHIAEIHEVETYSFRNSPSDIALGLRLREDVGANPTDLLHALDEALYQAMDREEAENKVRIAASTPVFFICLLVAARWTPLALIGAAFAFATFAWSALLRSQLATRVLKLILAKELATPAMREARSAGREMASEYVIRYREEERRREEAGVQTSR